MIKIESKSLTFTAGEKKSLGAGTYVGIISATGSVTAKLFKSSSPVSEDVTLSQGTAFRVPEQFERCELTSTSAQTVEYVLADGEYIDSRLNVLSAVSVTPVVANTITTAADVTVGVAAVSVVAANASRREVIITALSTNAVEVRVGDAAVGTARGVPLQPGQSITLETTAEIKAIASIAAQGVAVMEISNV